MQHAAHSGVNHRNEARGKSITQELRDTFNGCTKIINTVLPFALTFALSLYVGSFIADPAFFAPVHNPTPMMQAWTNFTAFLFEPVHNALGVTGDGGLLNSDLAKSLLAPWMPETTENLANVIGEQNLLSLLPEAT